MSISTRILFVEEGKKLEEVADKRLIDILPTIRSFGLIMIMKKVVIYPARQS